MSYIDSKPILFVLQSEASNSIKFLLHLGPYAQSSTIITVMF